MDRVFASQRNFEVPVGDPAQKMGQMGSGVDGLRAFDAVVLGQPGMPPMREGGVRLAHLPPEASTAAIATCHGGRYAMPTCAIATCLIPCR